MTTPEARLPDANDRELIDNVRPPDWKNPEPAGRYNLVVIGAGSAGLIASAVAAGLGARVALVERHRMGGDCLNTGCVPSKSLIRASRMVAEARRASAELGLELAVGAEIDFGAVMRRMRRLRARISAEDAATRYRDELGVDVFFGEARFAGRDVARVDGAPLRFQRALIAAGARAAAPPVAGLAQAGYHTNDTIFELGQRPRRLGVIGGGPVGSELAQAFGRLGCQVVVFEMADHLLPREDPDASEVVEDRLAAEGVQLVLGCTLEQVEVRDGEKWIRATRAGGELVQVAVDEILVAAGRAPNVLGLGLEEAGVEFDADRGVRVDDTLRTSNPRIFAAGDVCMSWKFTHAADAAAKIAVQNALFVPTKKLSSLVMPWCTYTDPEVAHVGLTEREAEALGISVDTYEVPLGAVNRCVLDGEDAGFVKIHVERGRDRIVGATVVASHAGEMISEVTLAMVGKLGLGSILNVIHPYPTQAEGIQRAAAAYTRARLTPRVKKVLDGWMALRRRWI